jgi:hypothetical protein
MAKITRSYTLDSHGGDSTTIRVSIWQELCFFALILLLGLISCQNQPGAQVAAATPIDARTAAAIAVYTQATADDWLQRAAIAQAFLNANSSGTAPKSLSGWGWETGGAVPTGARDPIRWQNALDAVDAVSSGSYVLPPACLRATAVAKSPAPQWPGAQCVVGDLVFAGGAP